MNAYESQKNLLNRMKNRGWLDKDQIDAAAKLFTDFYAYDLPLEEFEKQAGYGKAFSQLQPGLKEAVMGVILFGTSLQTLEAEQGWPARSAKVLLTYGLESLMELIENQS